MSEFDLVVAGGTVFDGTGKPGFRADIGIKDGRVAEVGDLGRAASKLILDAGRLAVAPGFIDSHGHSDFALAVNPPAESQVAQGFTTEVGGNCGVSPFPLFDDNRGVEFDPPGVSVTWTDIAGYSRTLLEQGMGINFVPQVGHMTIRQHVLKGEDREAAEGEILCLERMVSEAVSAGAWGFSTGLDYAPTRKSTTQEVIRLARAAREAGGIYTTHIRGYGARFPEALAEALAIGLAAEVAVVISHVGAVGTCRGRGNWAVKAMEAARRRGLRVACDLMLYPTSGVWWGPRAVFPEWAYNWRRPWVEQAPKLQALLGDPAGRARARADVEERRVRPKAGFDEESMIFSSWDDVWIEEVGPNSRFAALLGLPLSEAARRSGTDPVDLYLDLVRGEGENLSTVHRSIAPGDFDAFLADPWTMIGTDTVGTAIERSGEPFNVIQAHPRHYGTTARLLGLLVRDRGKLELAEAVRRLTSLPATFYGLDGRGVLRPGAWGDLVAFDPSRVRERGTYRQPRAYPEGFAHVLVNGVPVVRDGKLTGARAGRLVTRERHGRAVPKVG